MKNDKVKILIIDDEQVVIDSLVKICTLAGYDCDVALTAEEGLLKLREEKFDLAMCDIMLPEMSGFEVLQETKAQSINTYVIMTTGYSTVENAVKSLYEGAIAYAPKPFEVDEILSILRRGVNFLKIEKIRKSADTSEIVYVDCPSKYYRLGIASWVNVTDEGSALVGATDVYLKTVDTFDKIEFKEIGDEIYQGTPCAVFHEGEEYAHNLLSPVSGKIIERNEELINNINIIEKDPFFNGWLYRIIPSDIEYELKNVTSCSSEQI